MQNNCLKICVSQKNVYFTIYDGRNTKKDALLRRLGDCTTLYLSKLYLIYASKTRDCDTSLTALNMPRFNPVIICFNLMYSICLRLRVGSYATMFHTLALFCAHSFGRFYIRYIRFFKFRSTLPY